MKPTNTNLYLSITFGVVAWMASWLIEYFLCRVFAFPPASVISFVVKLNIFFVSIAVLAIGCWLAAHFFEDWSKNS